MFTGIIEEIGRVREIRPSPRGTGMAISGEIVCAGLRLGESLAVNGVCLTVSGSKANVIECDLSEETLVRTTLGKAHEGMPVNLERPLTVGSRLGGHFVLGHVDDIGRLVSAMPRGAGLEMKFAFPKPLERYLVYKGSIAVDGISLTIASLDSSAFTVAVIPHTLQATNLRNLVPGDEVNLEADILGKYFDRFSQLGFIGEKHKGLTAEYLKEQGF